MRLRTPLAFVVALAFAAPAMAQDAAVSQVLQRICIPAAMDESFSHEDLDAQIRALNLTGTDVSDDGIYTTLTYSLAQPTGRYEIVLQIGVDDSFNCIIEAPAGPTRADLERAIVQAVDSEWTVRTDANGRSWRRSFWYPLRGESEATVLVEVRSQNQGPRIYLSSETSY